MAADYIIVSGDTGTVFSAALTYSNGEVVDLDGAAVQFVMRAMTANRPLDLTGEVSIVSPLQGEVSFTPSAADSATVGNYAAVWVVTFSGGAKQTFPTEGYLFVEIQPNLSTLGGATLVGLPEVKDHLMIPTHDRTHDAKLSKWVNAAQALIEDRTGPMVVRTFDEYYEGGHATISLRHKPSYGYGTEPVLNLMAVSEYRGPIEYTLSIVPTPTQGSVYSVMLNAELGIIVRRVSGGGTTPFWEDPEHPQQSIHVVYEAGQSIVPENVNLACLDALRWWWDTTQATGKGSLTQADAEVIKPMAALPYHCIAMLGPTARHPSLA